MTNYLKRTVKFNQGLAYGNMAFAFKAATIGTTFTLERMRAVAGVNHPSAIEQGIGSVQKTLNDRTKHKLNRAFFGKEQTQRIEQAKRAQRNAEAEAAVGENFFDDSDDSLGVSFN